MLSFQALGTDIHITGNGEKKARDRILQLEDTLSRFKDTPLTRLNRQGHLVRPPLDLVRALQHALTVQQQTFGLVTPAILPQLEAIGYKGHPSQTLKTATTGTEWVIQPEEIQIPKGVRLDLGGTAKSWIAEEASKCLSGDFMLDAGGDIVLQSHRPALIQIEHPLGGPSPTLTLKPGRWGIATSSTQKRVFAGGHHLIDPRTGTPLESVLLQTTAVRPHLTEAEVLTKLAFLSPVLIRHHTVWAIDQQGGWLKWRGLQFERLVC